MSVRDQMSSVCQYFSSSLLPLPTTKLPPTNPYCRSTIPAPIFPTFTFSPNLLLSLICSFGRLPTLTLDNTLILIFPICSVPLRTSTPKPPVIHLLSGSMFWHWFGLGQVWDSESRAWAWWRRNARRLWWVAQCKGIMQEESPYGETTCLIVCPTWLLRLRVRIHKWHYGIDFKEQRLEHWDRETWSWRKFPSWVNIVGGALERVGSSLGFYWEQEIGVENPDPAWITLFCWRV